MKIADFIKESYIDFPGKLSSVVFTPSCNYKCPACHAKHLFESKENVNEKEFFDYLDSRKGWIEGVVICGGEPTLQAKLLYFIKEVKKRNLLVKLDTNGYNSEILHELLKEKLVDYVAMDIKGPANLYPNIIGKDFIEKRDDYEAGIGIVSHFPDYEFRTTIVPVIRENEEISFMTPEEIGQTARLIYECTGSNTHKYFLQPFVPRKNELIDSRLETFPETPRDILEKGLTEAIKYLPNTKVR